METSNSNLVINVAQLLKEPVGSTRKFDIGAPELRLSDQADRPDGEALEAHGVEGSVKITRLSKDLLVQGKVSGDVSLECSRCLTAFSLPVEGRLEEQYQPTVDIETGRPVHREAYEQDDTAFSISPNHELDLTEPVRQALLVALPLKPLCRDDCAGLCPQCGADLNAGPCDCEPDTADDRWAVLRELKLEGLPTGDGNLN
jgi:uncharacterized protein